LEGFQSKSKIDIYISNSVAKIKVMQMGITNDLVGIKDELTEIFRALKAQQNVIEQNEPRVMGYIEKLNDPEITTWMQRGFYGMNMAQIIMSIKRLEKTLKKL